MLNRLKNEPAATYPFEADSFGLRGSRAALGVRVGVPLHTLIRAEVPE